MALRTPPLAWSELMRCLPWVVLSCALEACTQSVPMCAPGKSERCVGFGGCIGGQVCNADGTRFGACECARPVTPVDAGGEVDSGVDASVDAGVDAGLTSDAGSLQLSLGPSFPVLSEDAGISTRAYDFDLSTGGGHFLLTWAGVGYAISRQINTVVPLSPTFAVAPVMTTPASSVAVARFDDDLALVVASGNDGVVARRMAQGIPVDLPTTVAPVPSLPAYVAVAWNGSSALVAWTTYGSVSLRRMYIDGTWLDASPQVLAFPSSTFVPHLAVASDGSDWVGAISASQLLIFHMNAAGLVNLRVQSSAHAGESIALEHASQGYLLATATDALVLAGDGSVLAGPIALPTVPGPMGVQTVDLARDGRHFFVARTTPDGVSGLVLDHAGNAVLGPFVIDAMPATGERCAVTALRDGVWLVVWGTANFDMTDGDARAGAGVGCADVDCARTESGGARVESARASRCSDAGAAAAWIDQLRARVVTVSP